MMRPEGIRFQPYDQGRMRMLAFGLLVAGVGLVLTYGAAIGWVASDTPRSTAEWFWAATGIVLAIMFALKSDHHRADQS